MCSTLTNMNNIHLLIIGCTWAQCQVESRSLSSGAVESRRWQDSGQPPHHRTHGHILRWGNPSHYLPLYTTKASSWCRCLELCLNTSSLESWFWNKLSAKVNVTVFDALRLYYANHYNRQPGRLPLPAMDGLSPIADVDRETEGSFATQHGDIGLPDLDASYGSTPRSLPAYPTTEQLLCDGDKSPTIESEPLAYLR